MRSSRTILVSCTSLKSTRRTRSNFRFDIPSAIPTKFNDIAVMVTLRYGQRLRTYQTTSAHSINSAKIANWDISLPWSWPWRLTLEKLRSSIFSLQQEKCFIKNLFILIFYCWKLNILFHDTFCQIMWFISFDFHLNKTNLKLKCTTLHLLVFSCILQSFIHSEKESISFCTLNISVQLLTVESIFESLAYSLSLLFTESVK